MTTATPVLPVQTPGQISDAIGQAGRVLAQGGLVVFPTETVYGLAANAFDAKALARLNELKERPAGKQYTLHLGQFEQIERYLPMLSARTSLFLRKALPGPLTVVSDISSVQWEELCERFSENELDTLYPDRTVGIRLPDHAAAQALLGQADFPVFASSANVSQQPAPTRVEEAIKNLDRKVDLILDGGQTRYERSSTVVKLEAGGITVLREGVLDKGVIERMQRMQVLFVCTGNSCRSPMAEGICKSMLANRIGCSIDKLGEKGYVISSAGTSALGTTSATPEAIEACLEHGVDISRHQSRLLTRELIDQSDRIFVMTRAHRHSVLAIMPQADVKTVLLDDQVDIADPIAGPLEQYRACAEQIAAALGRRLEELQPTEPEKGAVS